MSHQTTYYCDHCKAAFKDAANLINVKATTKTSEYGYLYRDKEYVGVEFLRDFCKPCAIKLGVIVPNPDKDNPRPDSDQDKLYEIISNMVAGMMPAQ